MGQVRFLLFPHLFGQQLFEVFVRQLCQVRPHRPALRSPRRAEDLLGFLPAVGLPQTDPQPFRQAEPNRVCLVRLRLRIGKHQFIFFANQVPQNAVANALQAFHPVLHAQLHAGVGGRALRNPVLQQDLAGAQPQDVPQLNVRILPGHHLSKAPVQINQVIQRVVHQPADQPPVCGNQAAVFQRLIQAKRSKSSLLRHLPNHPQGNPPRRHAFRFGLFLRLFVPRPHRPPAISGPPAAERLLPVLPESRSRPRAGGLSAISGPPACRPVAVHRSLFLFTHFFLLRHCQISIICPRR